MKVAVVDYGSGNLRSAQKAFERAASAIGWSPDEVAIVSRADEVERSDRVVVPGVGAFADCKSGIAAVDGLWEALERHVASGRPTLGICVGMQLLATTGLEHAETAGFGWIPGTVMPIEPKDHGLKVPHMGWNDLKLIRSHPLLDGCVFGPEGMHAYFCHSYRFVPDSPGDILLETQYGGPVTAMISRGNVVGAQFHPEKSQELGLRMIANFLGWKP